MAARPCSIDGCDKRHFGKGFCQKHYQRWRKHGDPMREPAPRDRTRPCIVDGCDRVDDGRGCGLGMCSMHYQRVSKYGGLELTPKARRVGVAPCSVDGCADPIKARDVCCAHLTRLYRHGSPTARVRAEVVNGCRICPGCKQDVPLDDWVQFGGKYRACRPCFLAEYRDRNHTRRTRLLGGEVEKFKAVEVFERDGWVCQLCSEPIDRDAKWPAPLSASLDHRVPVSRGGGHTRANTQASHLTCNLRKHAKMPDIEEAA